MRRHRPSHVRQREWVIILPVEVVSGHGPLLAVAQARGFTGLDTMVWRRSRSWWGGVLLILTLGMMDILLDSAGAVQIHWWPIFLQPSAIPWYRDDGRLYPDSGGFEGVPDVNFVQILPLLVRHAGLTCRYSWPLCAMICLLPNACRDICRWCLARNENNIMMACGEDGWRSNDAFRLSACTLKA